MSKNKKKNKKKKVVIRPYFSNKSLRRNHITRSQEEALLSTGYMNYRLIDLIRQLRLEMSIKNHLYKFISHKGLTDEYRSKKWEIEYNNK